MDAGALKYSVVLSDPSHILPIAEHMDDEERHTLESAGRAPLFAITNMFHLSEGQRWTAMAGGKPIAMWGVTGGELATSGEVWLVVTRGIRPYKFAIVREAMHSIRKMFETKLVLTSSMFCGDMRANKFAKALGFHVQQEDNINGLPIFRAVLKCQ